MSASTFDLLKDIFFILFFLIGTLWMWGKIKFASKTQYRYEEIFKRSRYRFKWLFLVGTILLVALFIWQHVLQN